MDRSAFPTKQETSKRASELRKVKRVLKLRLLGLSLGSIAVGAALFQRQALEPWLPLLLGNVALWPFLAYQLAKVSKNPLRAERFNLVVDSAVGGVWIALMHFMLAPSVLLFVTLAMDKLAFGGRRFLQLTLGAQILACAITAFFTGFALQLDASLLTITACIPHGLVYPMVVSATTFRLLRTVSRQHKQLAELNRKDSLTGLLNRRYWEEMAQLSLRRYQKGSPASSLLFLDIDRFKLINDQHGHPVGDAILIGFARAIESNTRDIDFSGRYAGDEFVVILTDTSVRDALLVGERLRSYRHAGATGEEPEVICSASIGVAELAPSIRDLSAWIEKADRALYQAKRSGRNAVVAAS